MSDRDYQTDVFINCPFDPQYQPLFRAMVFTVFDCGFRARCALEIGDAAEVRIDKIFRIIEECKYGIHDISRTQLDADSQLPRFNMPLELGMFLAAKRFGARNQKQKGCLILDSDRYRYQQFISDIAGQDIQSHRNDPEQMIGIVRNWLRGASGRTTIPGGTEIHRRYRRFLDRLPGICNALRLETEEITFNDFADIVSIWLEEQQD
jgi:hypothetical protein